MTIVSAVLWPADVTAGGDCGAAVNQLPWWTVSRLSGLVWCGLSDWGAPSGAGSAASGRSLHSDLSAGLVGARQREITLWTVRSTGPNGPVCHPAGGGVLYLAADTEGVLFPPHPLGCRNLL